MSHHYSGPDASFPHGDTRLDLTDLYAFPKPGSAGKSILIMNVHLSSSIKPPQPTYLDPFAADALYELKIDTDCDAVADIAYRVCFSPFTGGAQTAMLRRVEGAQAAGTGDGGQTIVEHAPVSLEGDARITEAGEHRFFAGWRSDPFFFDPVGALNNFQFAATIFSPTRTYAALCWKCPTPRWGAKRLAFGRARSTARAANGFRPIVARCRRNPSSFPATKGPLTSLRSRRTTPVSSLPLCTL